jgi:hypothetical protein
MFLRAEVAIEKLKSHKSPGIDQIPAELIKAGGRTIRFAIHKLIVTDMTLFSSTLTIFLVLANIEPRNNQL